MHVLRNRVSCLPVLTFYIIHYGAKATFLSLVLLKLHFWDLMLSYFITETWGSFSHLWFGLRAVFRGFDELYLSPVLFLRFGRIIARYLLQKMFWPN